MDFYESVVVLQGIFRDLGSLMQVRGLKSAAYSALSVGILGAGTAYVIAPQESLHNVLPYARGPRPSCCGVPSALRCSCCPRGPTTSRHTRPATCQCIVCCTDRLFAHSGVQAPENNEMKRAS